MSENTNPPLEAVAVTITEDKNEAKESNVVEAKVIMQPKVVQMKYIMLPLTIFSFLLSLPILFAGIWLLYMRQYDCEDLLDLPKLQVGIAIGLVFVFCTSNLVVYLRSRFPVPGLLLVMVPLMMMLTVGLGLVGAFKMETRTIPASPWWLKMKVQNNKNWNDIKSCIYDTRMCKDLVARSYLLKSYDFTSTKLTPIESGCCKPPSSCEMEYVNATFWIKGDGGVIDSSNIPYDTDCNLWENEETALCYNCHSCKQGFRTTLQGKWLKLGAFLIAMSLLLAISHVLLFIATMWEQYGG